MRCRLCSKQFFLKISGVSIKQRISSYRYMYHIGLRCVTSYCIFWLVLCSHRDVSFNIVCLNLLKYIKKLYLLMWFKNFRLETPFKGDNAKTFIRQIVKTWSFISRRKLSKLQCVFRFSVNKQSLENNYAFPQRSEMLTVHVSLKNVTALWHHHCSWYFCIL